MQLSSPTTVGKNVPSHPTFSTAAVTPDDNNDLATGPLGGGCIGLQVTGTGGNIAVNLTGGGTATLTGLSAAQILGIDVTRVLATGTTATGILALYRP